MMGSAKLLAAVLVVVLVAEVLLVAVVGNYSIAIEGGKAAVDEMMGNTDGAGEQAVQARNEAKEVMGNWGGWAKEKVQDGLGLNRIDSDSGPSASASASASDSTSASGVGQVIAEKAGKAKEKAYEAGREVFQKASDKAQQATEAVYETTKEAMDKAQVWKGKAAQEDREETAHKANEDQEASTKKLEEAEEEKAAQIKEEADEEVGDAMMEVEDGDEEEDEEPEKEGAKAQDSVSWAKQGYTATKRKASQSLHNAKRKITITGPSHGGEL